MSWEMVAQDSKHHDEEPVNVEVEIIPFDEAQLDDARTQWQFGDWMSLVALDVARIEHHPSVPDSPSLLPQAAFNART